MSLKHRHQYESTVSALKSKEHYLIPVQTSGKINVLLIFPSSYKFGVSNLGFLSVHRLLSSIPEVGCERFFIELNDKHIVTPPFYSFETCRPISDFDLLAFSISYECDFDKIPYILTNCGIPISSEIRQKYLGKYPLIIVGGAAVASNPNALKKIADIIIPYEAEITLPTLINLFIKNGFSLHDASRLQGIWVPNINSSINPIDSHYNINHVPAHSHIITPVNYFNGAFIIEIMRGCPRNCYFCLARNIYFPPRILTFDNLVKFLNLIPYNNIALIAPSLFDHPEIEKILTYCQNKNFIIHNSSVKWEKLNSNVLNLLYNCHVRSLTLAPETASPKLQNIINKQFSESEFIETIKQIINAKFESIKLYFIVGLPNEDNDDLLQNISFIKSIFNICKIHNVTLNLSFSAFIPKQHTPLSNPRLFCGTNTLKQKFKFIHHHIKSFMPTKHIKFESLHEIERQFYLAHADGEKLLEEYDQIRSFEQYKWL